MLINILASVQTIMQTVGSLVAGLQQVNDEVKKLGQLGSMPANDRFIVVMQARNDSPSRPPFSNHFCNRNSQ